MAKKVVLLIVLVILVAFSLNSFVSNDEFIGVWVEENNEGIIKISKEDEKYEMKFYKSQSESPNNTNTANKAGKGLITEDGFMTLEIKEGPLYTLNSFGETIYKKK